MKKSTISSWLKASIVIFAGSAVSIFAQNHEFQKYLGDPNLKDVAKKIRVYGSPGLTDYIITGEGNEFDGTTHSDLFLTNADQDGTTLWTMKYPAQINGSTYVRDWGNSVVATSDGGFVAVGAAESNGVRWAYIIKTDQNGTLLWRRLYTFQGSAEFYDILEDQGSYVVTGWTKGNDDENILFARFSSSGVLSTHRVLDSQYPEEGRSITKTTSGYAITGKFEDVGAVPVYSAAILLEINTALTTVSRYDVIFDPTPSPDLRPLWGNNIISTFDGGLMIVGGRRQRGSGATADIDHGVVLKFNSQRQISWANELLEVSSTEPSSEIYEAREWLTVDPMTELPNGSAGFFLAGYHKGTRVPASGGSRLVNSSGMLLRLAANGSYVVGRLYKPSAVPFDQTVHSFYSLDLRTQPSWVFGDVGVAAVGEAERIETNMWRDAWFAKTNGFGLNILCYKDNSPEVKPYVVEILPNEALGSKPPTQVLTTGLTSEYQPIQTICYAYHDIFGKQGTDIPSGLLRILPNPVKSGESLQMEVNLPSDDKATVAITDINGVTLYEGAFMSPSGSTSTHTLDIPKMAPGTYMVQVQQQQQLYTVKLIISE